MMTSKQDETRMMLTRRRKSDDHWKSARESRSSGSHRITGFHKKKKKQKEKGRLLRLLVFCADLKEESLAALLRDGNLLTQVGPFYTPMWAHFSRRLRNQLILRILSRLCPSVSC